MPKHPQIAPHRRRRTPPPHGDRGRYAYWDCRCVPCKEAERIYEKRRRHGVGQARFVPATGTVRRVQGLVAYGYSYADLAQRLGCRNTWLCQLARAERTRGVLRRTAEQITALYDQLTALPPPSGRSAAYARTVAAKHGWVSPWAWDDDRIDDPAQGPQGVARSVRSHRAKAGVR